MATISTTGIPMAPAQDIIKPVGKKDLDRGDFMTMFLTQLQYQDPLKPMESYEMASQLAQFSSMEATMKMSKSMDELLTYQKSQSNLQILNMLGTEVQVDKNVISMKDGKSTKTSFTLPDRVDFAQADIFDSAGRLVRSLDLGALVAGSHDMEWNGADSLGNAAGEGAYQYVVTALDAAGDKVEVGYKSTGTVTGVRFQNGEPLLTIDGQMDIPMSDVTEVGASAKTSSGQ